MATTEKGWSWRRKIWEWCVSAPSYEDIAATAAGLLIDLFFLRLAHPWVFVLVVGVAAGFAARRAFCEWRFPDLFSPLALDLDGDGVEADGQALFDHAGDGMAEASNWVSEDDGLLAWDRDGNGLIDSGRELFGDSTPLPAGGQATHGFAALASLDSNGDGVVDAKDAKWSELRVLRWTDANKNGWMDKGEQRLETLAQHGISSLSLAYTASTKKDAAGNEHRQAGSYAKTDGSTRSMVDVWFRADPRLRSYDKGAVPAHSAAVKALPDARGLGLVYDLRDAMALDAAGKLAAPLYAGKERTETRTLGQLVQAFGAAGTEAARAELLDKILLRWAGAEGVTHADYGWRRRLDYTTASRFAVVEAFEGRKITKGDDYRNPAAGLGQWINRRYQAISEHLRAELVLQQSYASELGSLKVKLGKRELATQEALEKLTEAERGKLYLDFTAARQSLAKRGAAATAEFVRSLAATFGASEVALRGLEQTAAGWQYRYEYQLAWLSASVSEGEYLRSNDYHGDDRANVFRTVDGGADTLRGGKGSDLYQLQAGTGHDTVLEAADAALPACGCPAKVAAAKKGNSDIVMLGPDVAVADARLRRDRDHLWVEIMGPADAQGVRRATDSLKIHNHYRGSGIEGVVFADGTEWDRQKLAATPFTGGPGNDKLVGSRGAAADAFDSSTGGNDSLYGLYGDDTYILRRGTGHDAVFEGRDRRGTWQGDRRGASGTDRVLLASGIGAADVRVRRDGDHLLIELLGAAGADGVRPATDSLKIDGYFIDATMRVETVEFADGSKWAAAKLDAVALAGGTGRDKLVGSRGADNFDSAAGGNDSLYGQDGGDTYVLRRGTGHDTVYEGRDSRGRWQLRRGFGGADRVLLGSGIAAADVRMRRDGVHLVVELLGAVDAEGVRPVTDSLRIDSHYAGAPARIEKVEFADGTVWGAARFSAADLPGASEAAPPSYTQATEPLRGDTRNESLHGRADRNDIFDADAGGNDILYGKEGNDVYRLGAGTGHDEVQDHYYRFSAIGDANDVVEIEAGFKPGDVQLRRDANHLYIQLLGPADEDGVRSVTDSLKIAQHYALATAEIEKVKFADGTVWTAAQFDQVAIRGGSGRDLLQGRADMDDVFDADAGGNDILYGKEGNDVYRLGAGTGHDEVQDHYYRFSAIGDANDVVEIEAGFKPGDVQLRRDANHLYIQLLGPADEDGVRSVTDSLKIAQYYALATAEIEKVKFADGTAWTAVQFDQVAIRGTAGRDLLLGRADMADVFDADAGGNDILYGKEGNDIYRLGSGTGHDVVQDHYYRLDQAGDANDVVEIEAGFKPGDVQLRRDANHLYIQLLGPADEDGVRSVTDSLKIAQYYALATAEIEKVKFADGTAWTAVQFDQVAIRGTAGRDLLLGRADMADVFDADAGGNDILYGKEGNDIYRLGSGTGHDVVQDHYYRLDQAGDANDVVEIEAGFKPGDVQLRRDANHLYIQLLGPADEDGVRSVTDSLKIAQYYALATAEIEKVKFADGTAWTAVQFDQVAIRGTAGRDLLLGRADMADVFDADAGGNDILYGKEGNDIYRLGSGTGHDVVQDHYYRLDQAGDANDVVEIEAGFKPGDVQLRRDANHLYIQLLGPADEDGVRSVTDSLKIAQYYALATAEIEKVKFADGTAWTAVQFDQVAIRGTAGRDLLLGRADMADVFDADAGGNDILYGKEGNDIYRLGSGTGHDVVQDHYYRLDQAGDANDVVEIEAGFKPGDVQLRRDANHLYIQLLGPADEDGVRSVTDSLKIAQYYALATAEIEKVKFADGTAWTAVQFDQVAIRGTAGRDLLLGRADMADVFDADAGGNDILYGKEGNDIYRLGSGTGHDVVQDHYYRTDKVGDANDVVEIEAGFKASDIQLRRDTDHLYIELLGQADKNGVRSATDSLMIDRHYSKAAGAIESIKFAGGKEWQGPLAVGGAGADTLSSAQAGVLYGGAGADVYQLSGSFGQDTIIDTGGADKLSFTGHAKEKLSLSRAGDDLVVKSLGSSDQVAIDGWYEQGGARRLERIESGTEMLLASAAERMVAAMAVFVDAGGSESSFLATKAADYWQAIDIGQ